MFPLYMESAGIIMIQKSGKTLYKESSIVSTHIITTVKSRILDFRQK